MSKRARARQVVLVITALVFVWIAVASLLWPEFMAEPFDYALPSANAMSEYRAIYFGLWLAHAVILIWAAWRAQDVVVLGDAAGILVLGQAVGRAVAVVVDGMPDARILPPAIAESLGGIIILALHPPAMPPAAPPPEAA